MGVLNQPRGVSAAKSAASNAQEDVVAARREIAGLLATAYGRLRGTYHVSGDRAGNSGDDNLANVRPQSVHCVVE